MDDYTRLLTHPDVIIYDEYGDTYTYAQFVERVLKFNGGIKGVVPQQEDEDGEKIPISHLDFEHGKYAFDYIKDKYGYEFTSREFS